MASTALTKAREETERVKKAIRSRLQSRSAKEKQVTIQVAGAAGVATSSVGCAFVDHHYAKDGRKQMTFGDSSVPVVGTLGAVLAVGSFFVAKKAPEAASFFGNGGAQAAGISIYNAVRQHLEDKGDEDED